MVGFDNLQPFRPRGYVRLGQAVVEEVPDGALFGAIVGNEADEAGANVADAFVSSVDAGMVMLSELRGCEGVPGPPKTRMSSLELPPLSLMGIT